MPSVRIEKCLGVCHQELMSAAKRREGASNYRTLLVPSSVESRAPNLAENAPYKVSSMFAPTSFKKPCRACTTCENP